MTDKIYSVLCRHAGDSARSILAGSILNKEGSVSLPLDAIARIALGTRLGQIEALEESPTTQERPV